MEDNKKLSDALCQEYRDWEPEIPKGFVGDRSDLKPPLYESLQGWSFYSHGFVSFLIRKIKVQLEKLNWVEWAKDKIKALEAENKLLKEPWISVEELLPDNSNHVLIWSKRWSIRIGMYSPDDEAFIGPLVIQQPTHWMPLPEPPTEKGGEL